jgi:hypothetical protein
VNPDPEITNYVEESRRMAGARAEPEVWSPFTVCLPIFLFALHFSNMILSSGFAKNKNNTPSFT